MRILLIITLAFTLSLFVVQQAQAQRYFVSQTGLQFTVGAVDAFKVKNEDKQAFYAAMAFSSYVRNGNRWVFGGEYLQKQYGYKDIFIPVSQITVDGGYYLNFLSNPGKAFFVSIGASAMTGYETVNWGKKLLFDGATIESKDAFLYGGAVTIEFETYLSDRIIILVNARERILMGSSINKYHTQIGVGFKFMLN